MYWNAFASCTNVYKWFGFTKSIDFSEVYGILVPQPLRNWVGKGKISAPEIVVEEVIFGLAFRVEFEDELGEDKVYFLFNN
jgi:hypothetical protein